MRPKTAIQKKFCEYAGKLPPLTERQRSWAYRSIIKPLALCTRHGRRVKCLCCGTEIQWEKPFFEAFLDTEQYDCYTCGRSMPIADKTRGALIDRRFFTVITTFRGYQLARTFEICRDNTGKETEWSIDEFYQNWVLPDGTEIITGRPHHRSVFSMGFNPSRPYEIKQHNGGISGYYQMDDMFDICGATIYPVVKVTPLLRRNGWRKELLQFRNSISMIDAMSWLLKCPTAEMLCKTGQLQLFRHMVREVVTELDFLHSVRIANRRDYTVEDPSLWLDMLSMAQRLGLDTHNPSVVCPEDLNQAHDRILRRIARLEYKDKQLSEIARIVKKEDAYKKAKDRFFGIILKDDGISVKTLESVQEVYEEGTAMHHCVYTMKYYEKKDSLLLSAIDADGNHLETVELSLRTFKVLQSRGRFNQTTPFHDRIVSLVESNAPLFRARAQNKPA